MSTNTIIPNFYPIPMTTTAYTENGLPYTQTNAGKIIGGTAGAIAGLSSIGDNNEFVTGAVNTAVMTAIGTGIGAAVDYLINKQRENAANKIDYRA